MEQVAEAVWVEVEKKWAEQQAKAHAVLIQYGTNGPVEGAV